MYASALSLLLPILALPLTSAAPSRADIDAIVAKGIPESCIPLPGQVLVLSKAIFPSTESKVVSRVSCDPTGKTKGFIFVPDDKGDFGTFNVDLGSKSELAPIRDLECKISAPSTPDKKMSPGETAMFILPDAPVNNIPPQGVNGVKVFCKPM